MTQVPCAKQTVTATIAESPPAVGRKAWRTHIALYRGVWRITWRFGQFEFHAFAAPMSARRSPEAVVAHAFVARLNSTRPTAYTAAE